MGGTGSFSGLSEITTLPELLLLIAAWVDTVRVACLQTNLLGAGAHSLYCTVQAAYALTTAAGLV